MGDAEKEVVSRQRFFLPFLLKRFILTINQTTI